MNAISIKATNNQPVEGTDSDSASEAVNNKNAKSSKHTKKSKKNPGKDKQEIYEQQMLALLKK